MSLNENGEITLIVTIVLLVILKAVFIHYAMVEQGLDTADHAALIAELTFIFQE